MKKLTFLFSLILLGSLSCSEDEVLPTKSDEELVRLSVEKVSTNHVILENVFSHTSVKVTRAAIQTALRNSGTKREFIVNMNSLVEDIFENELQSNPQQFADHFLIKLDRVKGESVPETVMQQLLDPLAQDPLASYSKKIGSLIETGRTSGRGLVVLIAKVVDGQTSEEASAEEFSLNFDEIKTMYDIQDRLIESGAQISAETDNDIDGIMAQEGIPPIAIALLVPAIQHVHCCSSQSTSTPYWNWLKNTVNPEVNGGLNREILRRYNAAGFMGALQLLLSDEYLNDDQDLASVQLLRARYQASLMFMWNDIWEKSKLAMVMEERVKVNESVLDSAFVEAGRLLTRSAIIDARTTAADKAEFFAKLNELVDSVFDLQVKARGETYAGGVTVAVGDVNGDGTSSQLAELLIKNQPDPLNGYANLIQTIIDRKSSQEGNTSADLDELFTIVDRVKLNGTERQSYMSVTPGALSDAKKIKDVVISGRNAGPDPDSAIENLCIQYNIPKPLMALLLPAIQKVHNFDGTAESAETPYLKWLYSLDQLTTDGISHDVVARYDAAGYLGALHLFVSDNYRSDNEDYASLLLFKARYQASLAMIFNDLWDK